MRKRFAIVALFLGATFAPGGPPRSWNGPSLADTTSFCARAPAPADPAHDIYCLELIPRPDIREATGVVELRRPPSPFDVAVSVEGHQLYDLVMTLQGLPDPHSLGAYATYVAWLGPPSLYPMKNLGEVRNGRVELGRVALEKFIVMVSAESSATVSERTGRLVLRGNSPSTRMQRHDVLMLPGGPGTHSIEAMRGWPMPPMDTTIPMYMPGIEALVPTATPLLPVAPGGAVVPEARPRTLLPLADGDTLRLEAGLVRRTINGQSLLMYGFNGQYPGPLLSVRQNATVVVDFVNHLDQPTAVHWHGVRLENRFDGAVGVTQEAVPAGGRFTYRVHFRDAGIYWYHSHFREDLQQDLGLYGNMLVRSSRPDYFAPVNREETLMLDDLLLGDAGPMPFGEETPTHALMGRFGNVFLINGEPRYTLAVARGEVVRFYVTNVANTRSFNLSFGGAPIKLVAADAGKFERESWVESVSIAPAQRYVVEVKFPATGDVPLVNQVQAINHSFGYFFPQSDTLGVVHVGSRALARDHSAEFARLRTNADVAGEMSRYRRYFTRPLDRELVLTLKVHELPFALEQLLQIETGYFSPVEWSGTMPMMDWLSTGKQAEWTLRDPASGKENMAIDWRFRVGDVVKIRLVNDRNTLHAMAHPIHLHGQRFLVLSQNGVPNDDLVWKDTILVPVGSTAELLVEMSNPGRWMLHCHIAEHLQAGMMGVFEVN
ncbi:MAG: multicopper oxidase family protein [Gemmatimonadetes bacterium]|nr:multicopper oxidase family protein [Gemmatimonadota bacterium]